MDKEASVTIENNSDWTETSKHSAPQQGSIELQNNSTYWYENGQKKLEQNYKDGKKHGKMTTWYENGQIEYVGNYKDGKEDGKWTYWDENGSLKFEGHYKDGKLDGKDLGFVGKVFVGTIIFILTTWLLYYVAIRVVFS